MAFSPKLLQMGAAGSATANFIEDVFSTYLYTGTGAAQTITNGINLAGKGGMVWTKSRSATRNNNIVDTVRGGDNMVYTEDTTAQFSLAGLGFSPFTFSSTGFVESDAPVNAQSGATFCSWTFRKQAKFFDVVTYTGNGANRTIAHNLGSVPGSIWVKRTDTTGAWQCYHRSLANTEYLVLNSDAAKATGATRWNSTTPTSSVFSLGTEATVNANGGTYVAYIFAHDAGGFGTAGTDNVISCGSFTVSAGGTASVTLGYEPQWVMVKASSRVLDWTIQDTMRGMYGTTGISPLDLYPNLTSAEANGNQAPINATGFTWSGYANETFVYVAIRRGPMKTPTSGSDIFVTDAAGANASANGEVFSSTFPVDFHFRKPRSSSANGWFSNSRLIPQGSLSFQSTSTEASLAYVDKYDRMSGIATTNSFDYTDWAGWLFKRAPGFFDQVCYTSGNSTNTRVTHNLGVAPELIIVKTRSAPPVASTAWGVYVSSEGRSKYMLLYKTDASTSFTDAWGTSNPTTTDFGINDSATGFFYSTATAVAYLFATVAGVSKVGSYTGTAAAQTINCGFTAGARFVMIKRTDSTGDWYVWDTARGIVSGNDPYLLLNDTAAEVTNTDYIDPVNSGFELSSTAPAAINADGGSFIFMAIA